MNRALAAITLCGLVCACGTTRREGLVSVESPTASPSEEWRSIARPDDATRLDTLPAIWTSARSQIAPSARSLVRTEESIVAADEGLGHAQPTPGSYRCRLIKVGDGAGAKAFKAFPSFFCYIRGEENGKLSFAKQTGSELPDGWLYPDNDKRMVFLGARRASSTAAQLRYGDDVARDLAGVVERVGPFRWRLVIPTSSGGVSVYAITPVPVDEQPPTP